MNNESFEDYLVGYGLTSFELMDIKQKYHECFQQEVEKRVQEGVDLAKEKMSMELEQKLRLDIQAEETEKNRKQCKADTTPVKQFHFDTVSFGDKTYDSREFIRPLLYQFSPNSDKQLRHNPYNGNWELHFRTKGPQFISAVNVVLCFIVNPSGPGNCEALVIFIKGRDRPLIFIGGILSTQRIMTVLQLEETSLNSKWVAEAFRRSLRDCYNISFLFIPRHAGGNILPDGSLTYVSSINVLPGMESLYPTEIKEHRLIPHALEFKDTLNNYKRILPPSWKAKFMVVERVKSILLPWFKNYGLIDDRVSVIVYRREDDKRGCIALGKRSSYESTVVQSLTDKNVDVNSVLAAANDVTVIFTISLPIESRRTCCQQFIDIILDLKGENGIENPTRKNIILLTETPAKIPEGFPAVYLTIGEDIAWGDINELQRCSGAFDYALIDFFYKNQYATNSLVEEALKHLRLRTIEKSIDYPSKSAEMSLVTAHLLKKLGIITDEEFNAMFAWLTSKEQAATSSSEALCQEIGSICSDTICHGEIQAAWQDGQHPSWDPSKFFVGNDGKYNFTPERFQQKITSKMKGTDSYNKSCQALEKQGYSSPNRTGEHTSTLKVYCEGIGKIERNFISLSPNLFSAEARQVVEKTLTSDIFHTFNNVPRHFSPLIKHKSYDLIAGQVITNFSAINPFKAISGSPGSGKTDLLMMQSLQLAKAGEEVIILDPTNSFCEFEWLEHKVPKEIVDETVVFWDMSVKGLPVNIFNFDGCSTIQQKRERLFSMLRSGSHLTGCNQLCILMNAVTIMIEMIEQGETNLLNCISLAFADDNAERKVKRRVLSMFSTIAINRTDYMSWDEILGMPGKIIVVSSGNATVKTDVNPLDVILDSFYSYKDSHRAGNVTLVLDEIQTMNLNEGAPIDIVLSKGRKLNISAFLASQRYSNGKDRLGRVFDYCDTKLFFTPMESCIEAVSAKTHIPVDVLRCFEQGECAFIGLAYSEYQGKNIPVKKAIVGKTYRPPWVGSYD